MKVWAGMDFEGVWAGFKERQGSIFSNHQHFAVSTGICGVACPLPASALDIVYKAHFRSWVAH